MKKFCAFLDQYIIDMLVVVVVIGIMLAVALPTLLK